MITGIVKSYFHSAEDIIVVFFLIKLALTWFIYDRIIIINHTNTKFRILIEFNKAETSCRRRNLHREVVNKGMKDYWL